MRIRWTPLALNDLKIISIHIERQRNLSTANRVCRIIYDSVQILRRFPESGKTGIEEGTREFVIHIHRRLSHHLRRRRSDSSHLAWRTE